MKTAQNMAEAYRFPNGFREQAENMYRWLLHYGLAPQWGDAAGTGDSVILLSPADFQCLRLMQKSNPARFGDAPETE
ncbi:hypothetical protein MWH03_00305 [Klebsiella pneumoniae]|nr:hypothetical protein [Klebsiella pneumoniae]